MREGGFLEITFTSGDVLLLDIGSDWTLTVQPNAWTDASRNRWLRTTETSLRGMASGRL
jgi:hypothetical protein